jgi:hypothetical protein
VGGTAFVAAQLVWTGAAVSATSAPTVAVVKAGYTQDLSQPPGTFIVYGLVLANRSASRDAIDVRVDVAFRDALRRSVGTDSVSLTGIPAGQTFYVAGYVDSNVSLRATAIIPRVTVGSFRPKRLRLPTTSNVRMTKDEYFDELDVAGTLRNPFRKALPEDATVYAVVFDRLGRVIGGGSQRTLASVQPHASVQFDLTGIELDAIPAHKAASVRLSVDPCGQNTHAMGECPVLSFF